MTDLSRTLSRMSRPCVRVNAARAVSYAISAGNDDPDHLMTVEAILERGRTDRAESYSPQRHIEVLGRLIALARRKPAMAA